jgi:predicted DNA-binding ribbon-helix-helix protein
MAEDRHQSRFLRIGAPLDEGATTERGNYRKSPVTKHSVAVGQHKTSISLEEQFWNSLRAIAHEKGISLSQLIGEIDSQRRHANLSSAIRLFVFDKFRVT